MPLMISRKNMKLVIYTTFLMFFINSLCFANPEISVTYQYTRPDKKTVEGETIRIPTTWSCGSDFKYLSSQTKIRKTIFVYQMIDRIKQLLEEYQYCKHSQGGMDCNDEEGVVRHDIHSPQTYSKQEIIERFSACIAQWEQEASDQNIQHNPDIQSALILVKNWLKTFPMFVNRE